MSLHAHDPHNCECGGEGMTGEQVSQAVLSTLPESGDALVGALTACEMLRVLMSVAMDELQAPEDIILAIGEFVGSFGYALATLVPEEAQDAMRERLAVSLRLADG